MRLSVRIGLAALLIFTVLLIKRNLDTIRDDSLVQPLWQYVHSSSDPKHPQLDSTTNSNNKNNKDSNKNNNGDQDAKNGNVQHRPNVADVVDHEPPTPTPTYKTTPIIIPNDRVIVMARLSEEDTSWVTNELGDWRNLVYTVDDPEAQNHTPINKGREALAYLQFIVEHYHNLPSLMVFLHSHRDGWPGAWHTDNLEYSNVVAVRSLQADFVQQNGYVNLRCQEMPGCPAEIQPFRNPPKPGKNVEKVYAQAFVELFNDTDVPEAIGAACCSQFAVSRDQVLKRPNSDYERFYTWVLETKLPDDLASQVLEYSWHMIFGMDPVYCPDSFQCYEDVYGDPYFW